MWTIKNRGRNDYIFLKFSEIFHAAGNPSGQILHKIQTQEKWQFFLAESVNFSQFRCNLAALAVVNWDESSYGLPKCCQNDSFFKYILEYPKSALRHQERRIFPEYLPFSTDPDPTKGPINKFPFHNKSKYIFKKLINKQTTK